MSAEKSNDEASSIEVDDGHSWVIDSLIQFLSGPVWNKPISAFIEKKSTVFEPDTEQDTPDHRLVHKEYRNLVDSLLGVFVEELHISPSQFQNAVSCGGPGQTTISRFQPGALLEQVWAASDFTTFNRLMGLRNLELQLQALDSLRQHGNTSMALVDDGEGIKSDIGEDRLLKHVLRRSMEEASIMERMKKFNRLSLAEPMLSDQEDILKFQNASASQYVEDIKQEAAAISAPIKRERAIKETNVAKSQQDSASMKIQNKLTDEEIQKRKEYLCQQRDKLLQAKGRNKPIPGSTDHQSDIAGKTEEKSSMEADEDALQLRRALVNRLKAEVINKN